MIVKFLSHGQGCPHKASSYFQQGKDHKGEERDSVRILRGDPDLVAKVANSLSFKHKYTSAVINWHVEDKPTEAHKNAVLNDFEAMAFAGLQRDQYAWSAIEHRENNDKVHIHIFAARCDLSSGKSLNIAPPGWKKAFNAVRDYHNAKNGWADPESFKRARFVSWRNLQHLDKQDVKQGLNVDPNSRQVLAKYLEEQVVQGNIENREDLLRSLEDLDLEIPRQGKNYITVLHPETNTKFRLKGAMFKDDFQRANYDRAHPEETKTKPGGKRAIDKRAVEKARESFRTEFEKRALFNTRKYPRSTCKPKPTKPNSREKNSNCTVVEVDNGRSDTKPWFVPGSREHPVLVNNTNQRQRNKVKSSRRKDESPIRKEDQCDEATKFNLPDFTWSHDGENLPEFEGELGYPDDRGLNGRDPAEIIRDSNHTTEEFREKRSHFEQLVENLNRTLESFDRAARRLGETIGEFSRKLKKDNLQISSGYSKNNKP